MFTGIVEETGTVLEAVETDLGRRLVIGADTILGDIAVGASVSVEGACLTVTRSTAGSFAVELVAETLTRTSLGSVRPGDRVNLERAMLASGRFDGHVVQGHVDGVGTVRSLRPEGEGFWLSVACPPDLLRYVVEKGSITVNGVSLTVAALDDAGFEVALIPHTVAVTTLGALSPGDRANLEVDILAKYVERLLETRS